MRQHNIKIDLRKPKDALMRAVFESPDIEQYMFEEAQSRFVVAKQRMIDEFEDHPVTQELKAASQDPQTTSNFSDTLGGASGNLFTFIGFEFSRGDPTKNIEKILRLFTLNSTPIAQRLGKSKITYTFAANVYTMSDIEQITPMPWGGGSWVHRIETNIPGMPHYLFSTKRIFKTSRSGPAIQIKRVVRQGAGFHSIEYMSKIISNFYAKLFFNIRL